MERIHILGTPVDNLTMKETLDLVKAAIDNKQHLHHTVVNAGKIVLMDSNKELQESVVSADIINADGQAVVWAAKLLGSPLKERVAGIDLMNNIIAMAAAHGYKIFLFGAKEATLLKMKAVVESKYGTGVIAGYRNGYFNKADEPKIARQIVASGAHILFVAISSPIKENFLYQNRAVLQKLNFVMGVGGSFDVVAGEVKRAPVWMQRSGLEWLYRVYQEPRRMFKRYLVGNLKFIKLVMSYKCRMRQSIAAIL